MTPLAIDLFAGKLGWSRGLVAAGWKHIIAVDLEWRGDKLLGVEYVIQDVLTLHGSQFRNASLIVASPPCQNYSYLAMPWSRSKTDGSQTAKALRRKWETEGPDNRLFDACFRIQREAIEAAGRYIPLIVENVRGAQPWVGQAKANYGSFFLWGDVETVNGAIVAGQVHFGADLLKGTHRKGEGSGSIWFYQNGGNGRSASSKSKERHEWTAQVAMIPPPLAEYIGNAFHPQVVA